MFIKLRLDMQILFVQFWYEEIQKLNRVNIKPLLITASYLLFIQ